MYLPSLKAGWKYHPPSGEGSYTEQLRSPERGNGVAAPPALSWSSPYPFPKSNYRLKRSFTAFLLTFPFNAP